MRRRWLITLLSLALVAGGRPAFACSCVQFTKAQLGANASVVFTGVVTGASRGFPWAGPGCTTSSTDPITFTFDVETIYKGDVPRNTSVTTVVGGPSCGYDFVAGKRYTVFATASDGKLETNLCRGNVEGTIAPVEYGLAAGRPPR